MSLKKSGLKRMRDVYALLQVSEQVIYKWRNNSTNTQSREFFKHIFIERAGKLFSLSYTETEKLANKAGLSLFGEKEGSVNHTSFQLPFNDTVDKLIQNIDETPLCEVNFTKNSTNTDFAKSFNDVLSTYSGRKIDLCGAASVSERMFRYIKSGRHLRKEPILALLIVMGLNLASIQELLKKAGFILSLSMPNDAVVMWILENKPHCQEGAKLLNGINEVLYSLELPLLMTRWKD